MHSGRPTAVLAQNEKEGLAEQMSSCAQNAMKRRLPSDDPVRLNVPRQSAVGEPAHKNPHDDASPRPRASRRDVHCRYVEPVVFGYEHALDPDVQYRIMRMVIDNDPLDALHLASSSRQQTAILESLNHLVVRASVLMPTDVPLSTRQLLAANVGLGRRLAGGTSPQDWEAAVAASLMQGFVKFLFTGGRLTRAAERVEDKAPFFVGRLDPDTDHAADVVDAILGRLPLERRTKRLYKWMAHGSFGAYLARNRRSWFATQLSMRNLSDGYLSWRTYAQHIIYVKATAVRVGDHPHRRTEVKRDDRTALAAQARALQPIMAPLSEISSIAFPKAFCRRTEAPLTWRSAPFGETRTAPIKSAEAEAAIRTFLDDAVRDNMGGPCAQVEDTCQVMLPLFSDFFPGAIFVADAVIGDVVYMDLRSPRIERLLGESFYY